MSLHDPPPGGEHGSFSLVLPLFLLPWLHAVALLLPRLFACLLYLFLAIFMIPWIYSAWKSRHWNLEQTKLKVLRISKWGIKHRKITKILSNTCYLDNLSQFAWKQERRCLVLHLWPSLPRSYHSWHRHQPSPSPITDIADTRHTARLITMHGINNRKQLVQHYLQNGPSLLTWSRLLFKPQRLEEQMCRYSSS